MNTLRPFFAALLPVFFVGCATVNDMAINEDSKTLDLQGKSLLLMHIHVENKYKPSFQPEVIVVNIETPNAKNKQDRQNFKVDDEGGATGSTGSDYYVRMLIEPGSYIVRGMTGTSKSFPIIANFFAPLHDDITVEKGKVLYLGTVNAVVRERVGDEFRAGPLAPLVDQAIAGYSGGTFDVEIVDNEKKDIDKFKSTFPVLQDTKIEKQVLSKFDRQKAQQWWSAH